MLRAETRAPTVELIRPARPSFEPLPAEVFGPYLVGEELGSGGMATVHRAEHRGAAGFRRTIALKRLLPHVAADAAQVTAFTQEARLAAYLRHHNIAQTYDLGQLDGTYYIAMEHVPGPTLKDVIVDCEHTGSAIPLAIVLEILIQLCDALDHAHSARDEHGRPLGIIHRDVSPANVILASTGVVKLIDFGIAKAAFSATSTATGIMKGKLGYIAPEYLAGDALDLRADLYAVGVIAYELLTGARLFVGPADYATACAVRERPIAAPSTINPAVPPDLDDIVLTALARDPAQRWQNARAIRVALASVARTLGVDGAGQMRDWLEYEYPTAPLAPITEVRPRRLASGSIPPFIAHEPTVLTRRARSSSFATIGITTAVVSALGALGATAWLAGWLPL